MNFENKIFLRKSFQLKGFDYNAPGAYFVTFCTQKKKINFITHRRAIHESHELQLIPYGVIVDSVMQNIPELR